MSNQAEESDDLAPVNLAAKKYRRKFDGLLRKSQEEQQRIVYVMVGLGIVFLINGSFLAQEDVKVWIYVALILAAGLWCLLQVKEMRSGFGQVLNHLVELGKQTSKGEDIHHFLSEARNTDDESHVPESVSQLISSPRSVPAIQAVAEACFVYPASRLELIGYFRTFLVLAGLFGTVLFFGISIKEEDIASNSAALLGGIAGAFACTLMGISSSGLVGVMAGIFQRELDVAVIETEAFLGEVVYSAQKRKGSAPDPTDETQLWESLRQEVAGMTHKMNDRFDKLMDDRVEQLKGLNVMVDALNSLPQVRFPKGWEQLATNLESFSESVTVVDKSVKALVEARGTIEVLAPAVIAKDLQEVQERVAELSKSGTEALDDIKTSQKKFNENLEKWEGLPTRIRDELKESMGIVRTIQHDVSDVKQAALELAPKVSRFTDENSELTTKISELSANSERVGTHVSRMGTSIDKLVEITWDLKQDIGQQSKLLRAKIPAIEYWKLRGVREKLSEIWGRLRMLFRS